MGLKGKIYKATQYSDTDGWMIRIPPEDIPLKAITKLQIKMKDTYGNENVIPVDVLVATDKPTIVPTAKYLNI